MYIFALALVSLSVTTVVCQPINKTITAWDIISHHPLLGQFRHYINLNPPVRDRLANPAFKFTVFAYTDEAYKVSQGDQMINSDLILRDTIKYHLYDSTAHGLVPLGEFGTTRDVLMTMHGTPVYTSAVRVTDHYNRQQLRYYVNHAEILEGDYVIPRTPVMTDDFIPLATTWAVVYLIDHVLVPIGKPQNVYGFLQETENHVFRFNELIDRLAERDPQFWSMLQKSPRITLFLPSDTSFARLPKPIMDRLLKDKDTDLNLLRNTLLSHFNFKSVYFTGPMQPNEQYPMEYSTLEISKDDYNNSFYFISCNNVRTRLLMRNIPLTNGVIHMIDDVLYPYEDVPKKLLSMLDLQAFATFVNEDPQLKDQLSDTGMGVPTLRYTALAPSDNAVSESVRYRGANGLNLTDKPLLANFTRAHILREELRLGDIKRELSQFVQINPFDYPQFVRRTTLAGTDLRFYRIWNGTYYVHSTTGGRFIPTMATIITNDMRYSMGGATNGIIHYLDEFMGRPGRSVYHKSKAFPLMNSTYRLIEKYGFDSFIRGEPFGPGYQSGSGGQHLSPGRIGQFNYTIFAPNESSWRWMLEKDRAEELLQNADAMSRVLRRHMARSQGSMFFLPDPSEMNEASGPILQNYNNQQQALGSNRDFLIIYTLNYRELLRIRRVGDNYELLYGTQIYKVLYPNIGCADGVIHIIDRPILIKDDPGAEILGASSFRLSVFLSIACWCLILLSRLS